jgi:hypothetical protein
MNYAPGPTQVCTWLEKEHFLGELGLTSTLRRTAYVNI